LIIIRIQDLDFLRMTPVSSAIPVVARVGASLLGGYAFVWGFTTLSIAVLVGLGMDFDEARTLVYLLAFLVFLTAFCWAHAARSVAKVWAVLGGGGLVMTLCAWLLVRTLA
jgi:hypothetical protein